MAGGDLTDEEWDVIGVLLPSAAWAQIAAFLR